jgi:alpha-L-arabinofuranosidase
MCAKSKLLSFLLVVSITEAGMAATARISIQADQPGIQISRDLYGIFFEDINYGADGGLYAELVQNRSFEFHGQDALYSWSKVETGGSQVAWSVADEFPLHPNNPQYLSLKIGGPGTGAGIANSGFDGIAVKAGEKYLFSVHARTPDTAVLPLTVQLLGADGAVLGQARLKKVGKQWSKSEVVLKSSGTDDQARLVLLASGSGTMDFDMISLFPKETWAGRPNGLRKDLVKMLADMKPAFMRFPGGCIVEGKDLANAYRWKDTIGDVAERKANWNRWQVAMPKALAPQYYQSYGLGFYEFFQLCEDIGASPLPVLNCGMSCQFMDKQFVPLNELDPWIQDALDLIEFANGPKTSTWGAKRTQMGHPKPFNLKFLGVGNEQWGHEYFDRYAKFHAVLKARHPEIQLITSTGPGPDDQWFKLAWERLKTQPADIVDEHYYKQPAWFLSNVERYSSYDRKGPKIFAGEYAAHTAGWDGNNRCNLYAALSEAAFMTGLERNSDVVQMASYAPLFAKVGRVQWAIDLIWFDNTRVYGSPSYQVQKLYSLNRPHRLLPARVEAAPKTFYVTAGEAEKKGTLILKAVNVGPQPVRATVAIPGWLRIDPSLEVTLLTSGSEADENSFEQPDKVAPRHHVIRLPGGEAEFEHQFPPWSLSIIQVKGK